MSRLLSFNSYHYRRGGSDVVYLEHDEMFRALGWDTAVMSMHHPKNEPSEWSRFFVDEIEFGHDYPLWRKVAMAGKVVYSTEANHRLDQLLAEFRPDVAHAHCIYHHLSPSVFGLLRSRGIPTVLTAHDFKIACPAYKMANSGGICERCRGGNLLHLIRHRCIHGSLPLSSLIFVESALHRRLGTYRKLDRIVAPSRFHRDKFIEWGFDPAQLVHIPNYVNVERFQPAYPPGDYALYLGRLVPEKGVATLIRAAGEAGIRLVLAGSGPDEAALRGLVPAGAPVEFVGYRSGDSLRVLTAGARVLVLPSELYENAPISVLEAMACGKPVIGARIGGIPELVVDGETGLLFESGSVEELAGHLTTIRRMPDASVSELGRAGRRSVERRFTPLHYRDSMVSLYRELGVAP